MVIDLRAIWDEINAEFWAGRLPVPVLEFGQPEAAPVHAFAERYQGGGWLVRVSAESVTAAGAGANPVRVVADLLLHEAVHVAVGGKPPGHGRGFRRECRRIGRALGLPTPAARDDFLSWPRAVRPVAYYTTIEIGAGTWR